jgi:hypothetical protein
MKMKAIHQSFVVALLAVLLAACQFPGAVGVGSLKISVPSPSGARQVAANAGKGDLVRIQLVRNGVIVPLSGQDFLEQGMAGQTVTIDSLPTGTGYKIYVASGQKNFTTGGGFFETAYFQSSDSFEISAGTSTAVSVTLAPTPVSVIEDVANSFHAVTVSGSSLYFIEGTDFDYTSNGDPSTTSPTQAVANYSTGARVTSISNTPYGFWFNTSRGVLVSSGSTIPAFNMLNSSGTPLSPVPQAYTSGTIILSAGALAYYYGPGLTAGFAASSSSTTGDFNSGNPKWSTLSAMLNLSSSATLQNALNKLDQAVYGVASDNKAYVYLSTGIGTFRLDSTLVGQNTSALGDNLANGKDNNQQSILVATDDGSLIGPVSTYSDGSATAYAFAGTGKGLFASTVGPTTGIPDSGKLSVVAGTSGLNITSLATRAFAAAGPNFAYTAAYSASSREVLIYQNLTLIKRISALAGLPSGTPQFTWYQYNTSAPATTHLLLVITGTDATVEYEAATWPTPLS